MTSQDDLAVVRRAGRTAAIQASLALAGVLLVVGVVIFLVDVHVQNQQIADQLMSVAATVDDATDPPPGMQLVLRDPVGKVQASAAELPAADLLARPAGISDVEIDGAPYRVYVADKPEGRVVTLLALDSYEAARNRLLLSLGAAELAGILASVAVVVLLTRRSLRPLTEALALQRRFVADASHELRAPLTLLHTRIQLLARRVDDGDLRAVKDQIDTLAADTRVLGEVIEDLLASASMAGRGVPHVRVDAAAIADEVHRRMVEPADNAGVRLVLDRDFDTVSGDVVVLGSAAALRRAVTSLVDNALAHEHPGGLITMSIGRRGADVVIEVRDDGVGIDPDTMGTLFTRFSHGHRHTSDTGLARYGIGLALVREIAHTHRGTIDVSETPRGRSHIQDLSAGGTGSLSPAARTG